MHADPYLLIASNTFITSQSNQNWSNDAAVVYLKGDD